MSKKLYQTFFQKVDLTSNECKTPLAVQVAEPEKELNSGKRLKSRWKDSGVGSSALRSLVWCISGDPSPFAASIIRRLIELTPQSCPVDPRASCSLSASHNNIGITQTGEVWEPTEGVHPGPGRGCRGSSGREREEDPPFQFHSVFPNEWKGGEWCPLSPCHTGTFKKAALVLSQVRCLLERQKRGKEWVGKEFNGGPLWGTGSGRMATLAFVKGTAGLLVLPACLSLALWNWRWL